MPAPNDPLHFRKLQQMSQTIYHLHSFPSQIQAKLQKLILFHSRRAVHGGRSFPTIVLSLISGENGYLYLFKLSRNLARRKEPCYLQSVRMVFVLFHAKRHLWCISCRIICWAIHCHSLSVAYSFKCYYNQQAVPSKRSHIGLPWSAWPYYSHVMHFAVTPEIPLDEKEWLFYLASPMKLFLKPHLIVLFVNQDTALPPQTLW